MAIKAFSLFYFCVILNGLDIAQRRMIHQHITRKRITTNDATILSLGRKKNDSRLGSPSKIYEGQIGRIPGLLDEQVDLAAHGQGRPFLHAFQFLAETDQCPFG